MGLALSSVLNVPAARPASEEFQIYVRQNAQTTSISTNADGSLGADLGCMGDRIYGRQDWNSSRMVSGAFIFNLKTGRTTGIVNRSQKDRYVLAPEPGNYSAVCEAGRVVLRLGEDVQRVELK